MFSFYNQTHYTLFIYVHCERYLTFFNTGHFQEAIICVCIYEKIMFFILYTYDVNGMGFL